MAWPERRDLAADNAASWRQHRAGVRRRDTGRTALMPEDGYLDVRDAAGNNKARIGNGDILVPDGSGGWVGLNTMRATVDQTKADLTTLDTETDSRFTNAWTSINSKADSSSVDSRFTNAWSAIDSKASSESVDSRFTNIWATVDATSGRLSTLEQWRTVVENQIIGLNQEIQTLKQRVTALEQAGNTT